jgi:hypothetical protein
MRNPVGVFGLLFIEDDQETAVRRAVPMDRDFAALNGLVMIQQ